MKFDVSLSLEKDLACLGSIETRAAGLFATHALTRDLDLDAGASRDFGAAHAAELLWVARDAAEVPVGFALVEPLDGAWHLEEVDVDLAHGQKGIGTALVRAACGAAVARGIGSVTLCTFREVPWNAPFYARLGFAPLESDALSPGYAGGWRKSRRGACRWRCALLCGGRVPAAFDM